MDYDRVVRDVMKEARRHTGGNAALADALHEQGVGPENGRYSESGISNWTLGRAMPPASVLLAAAAIADLSLDRRIGASGVNDAPADDDDTPPVRQELEDLRRQCARLETLLIDLYNRTGQSYPHTRSAANTRKRA